MSAAGDRPAALNEHWPESVSVRASRSPLQNILARLTLATHRLHHSWPAQQATEERCVSKGLGLSLLCCGILQWSPGAFIMQISLCLLVRSACEQCTKVGRVLGLSLHSLCFGAIVVTSRLLTYFILHNYISLLPLFCLRRCLWDLSRFVTPTRCSRSGRFALENGVKPTGWMAIRQH